jgi:hypothetical protein
MFTMVLIRSQDLDSDRDLVDVHDERFSVITEEVEEAHRD